MIHQLHWTFRPKIQTDCVLYLAFHQLHLQRRHVGHRLPPYALSCRKEGRLYYTHTDGCWDWIELGRGRKLNMRLILHRVMDTSWLKNKSAWVHHEGNLLICVTSNTSPWDMGGRVVATYELATKLDAAGPGAGLPSRVGTHDWAGNSNEGWHSHIAACSITVGFGGLMKDVASWVNRLPWGSDVALPSTAISVNWQEYGCILYSAINCGCSVVTLICELITWPDTLLPWFVLYICMEGYQ